MIEYFIAIILVVIGFALVDNQKQQSYKKLYIIVTWLYLTFLLGFRFQVGGDTINYMGDYGWRKGLSDWEFDLTDIYQPGYTLLCAIGKSISPEFYVFQLIHAALVNTLLFIFINKYTRYFFAVLLSVFFTCYLYFTTEILREVIAVLIFALNYRSFTDKRWLRYYLGVLLCCTFHISAIFLVILPLLRNLKINGKFFILFIVTFIAMYFLRNILNILSGITIISGKINSYKDMTSVGMLADILTASRISIFPLIFCIVAKYICRRKVKFENMIAIMSLLGLAAFFSPIIFNRATNYFMLFFSLSIADFCIRSLRQNSTTIQRYSIVLTICFFTLYGSGYTMYGKYCRWVPYYSIFNPIEVNRDNFGDNK